MQKPRIPGSDVKIYESNPEPCSVKTLVPEVVCLSSNLAKDAPPIFQLCTPTRQQVLFPGTIEAKNLRGCAPMHCTLSYPNGMYRCTIEETLITVKRNGVDTSARTRRKSEASSHVALFS